MIHDAGFTLTELLVVIVMLGVLGVLILPALAGTKPNAVAFQCLQNQRQMVRAWQMYAEDNQSILVASLDQPGGSGFFNGRPIWMKGNVQVSPYNWDVNTLTNSPLYNYVGKSFSPFKCPADLTSLTLAGTIYPSVRSISMSQVFDFGQWLPATKYRTYGKLTEIVKPANTFVFIDENPIYMNDAAFATECDPSAKNIIDLPANYHDKAAGISFADGHAEMHRWTGPLISSGSLALSYSAADAADWQYLANNSTVLK
jgi:prepilin-type N-terminal cleavage/methylation domain-containing protein/prepilin-type processing-associated H-X9-DG protein